MFMIKSIGTVAWTALLLAACSDEAPPAPPPLEVSIVVVQSSSIDNIAEVPGRVQAVRTAQVRARVDGIVKRRLYEEGSDVKAGQQLFSIDPRELNAKLHAAEALLVRAAAMEANAAQDVERYKGLIKEHVISQQAYDTAVANLRTAQADVAQAQAQVESARLNLSYTTVTAPIAGRARRAEVTEGALVSATSATLLTTIEQLHPIYVNFSQSSADLLSLRREISAGTLKVPELAKVAVNLVLEDGSKYSHAGHMNFLDLSIDETTGTAAMRAEFPNPDRTLLPGQFVRAQISAGVRPNGFVLPQRAVKLTPQGASVMIVDNTNAASSREIKVGALREGSWVVLEGLQAGDRVIVDGLQKVQPGNVVSIVVPETKNAAATSVTSNPPAAR
ncbi:MAG: efflux RND transporter periplasmic adaptor subunit [Candidatus Obscuribacterales bacterium]|nr:efflux RND transporter periplasmic adaptor subunit [Steroidobacteraceae bacterium]